MINVVCVKSGTLYGAEYVNVLFDSVCRNLGQNAKFKFFCFTNDPEGLHEAIQVKPYPENLTGWWPKLYLFKNGLFPDGERIIYIDLSTVIVNGLDDIFKYEGVFAILKDFYRPDGWQSSVMSWKAGSFGHVWDDYERDHYPSIEGGDQSWIEQMIPRADFWQDILPGQIVSYKVHCENGVPKGARIVKFHGVPMPHSIKDGWIPHIWKVGGGSSLELMIEGNTHLENIKDNVRYSIDEGIPVIDGAYPAHGKHAVIIGGGPSINSFVDEIKSRKTLGQDIIALNNSWKWLEKRLISADYHVMLDARPENSEFVPPSGSKITRLYATQCDHRVINLSKNENTILWNSYIGEVADAFNHRNMFWIGSGTTVGIRSIFLLYTLGYRHFHLYGYDSSYEDNEGHAYEQKLNHGEKVIDVVVHGRTFKAAPWMVTQSQDFLETMEHITGLGCEVTIHGDGLLPWMAKKCLIECAAPTEFELTKTDNAPDARCKAILSRIKDVENPIGVEVGTFAGDLSKRLLRRNDLKLYLVDSWKKHEKNSQYAANDFHGRLSLSQQESYYNQTIEVTRFAKDRVSIVRKDSLEAVNDFEDQSLDFVFLDADHTYEAIKADIEAWYPKVKVGGYLCGHDYANHEFPAWGVEKAVSELCESKKLAVDLGYNFTWFTKREK